MQAVPISTPGSTGTGSLLTLPVDRVGSASAAEPHTVTILIVDDHRSFPDLLSGALNMVPGLRCVATAATAADGIARAADLQPDIVAIDSRMACGEHGLLAVRSIRDAAPGTMIAVISAYRDAEWITRASQAGASAFIPKTGSLSEMLDVLHHMRPGYLLVAPSTYPKEPPAEPNHPADPRARPESTAQQHQTVQHPAPGAAPTQTTRQVGSTPHTFRGHLKALHHKLTPRPTAKR